MNRLTTEKRAKIISLLVEGVSMRSIERIEGVSVVTVARLISLAGAACGAYHDEHVRGIKGKRNIQCDEIWSFVYAKEKKAPYADPWDAAGNAWLFTALDADSKLFVSYLFAKGRTTKAATRLFKDLTDRFEETPHITTDHLKAYRNAAKIVFGRNHKAVLSQMRKYEDNQHSTAYVERSNLSIRMENRRFNRKTNAFSKKLSKHRDMFEIWALHYNFCRIHSTLQVTPAMEAGLTNKLRDCEWIVGLIDASTPPSKKPGPKKGYKRR